MYRFQDFIRSLERLGVLDVLLPFVLIFAVVFAALEKIKIFGAEKKNIHIIIALAAAFSVVAPHVLRKYPPGYDVVEIINAALPQISLLAVAIICVLIIVGLIGAKTTLAGTKISTWAVLGAIALVAIIFGSSIGLWRASWLYDIFGPDIIALAVMLLIFGIVIWYISKKESGGI